MTLDIRARAVALKMLKKYGKPCTLKRNLAGVYDPAVSSVSESYAEEPIYVYFDSPNKQDLALGVISTNEVAVFAAQGLTIEPRPGDFIRTIANPIGDWFEYYFSNGELVANMLVSYGTITTVSKIWSGEQVALWRCGLAS